MRNYLYNNVQLKQRRRALRKNQTDSEKSLWFYLRRRSLEGLKFFRQYAVGHYILDFFCPEARLGIEIDGGQHAEDKNISRDNERTKFLEQEDIRVLRFWNNEVLKQKEAVVEKIREVVIKRK